MRIERNARRTQANSNRERENPGSPASAGARGDLNPDFTDRDLSEPTSTDNYQDQARTSWLAAQAATQPEIRSERIATLKNAIANGTYQVAADQIAEAILLERQTRDGTAA
jgi:flagellar biosynthesis anti-sigma factor FlgM